MSNILWDVIIIGGAAAGLTAAMYTARRKVKTLVITKETGGQTATATYIENYPGFSHIAGPRLMQKFEKGARKAGAEIFIDEVSSVKEHDKKFTVTTTSGDSYEAKSLILTFGKTPRDLGVPGEDKLKGRGVSYCATCDVPLFSNKTIAVVGGGNSALDAAIYGSKTCKKVYLVHRRDSFRGFEYMVERAKARPNIEILYNSVVAEIKGDGKVSGAVIQNTQTNEKKEIQLDGVFVEIGHVVKTDFLKGLVNLNDNGEVIVDINNMTSRQGVFAAGDLTQLPFKQVITSAGDGCKAALAAYNYLNGVPLDKVRPDWK
ncbi:thioredoxin-disulfide reductase [archaeon]|nr:MAG: thioredoxin-disulfide reductase [archaeon]